MSWLLPTIPDCRTVGLEWFDPTLHPRKAWTNELFAEVRLVRDHHMITRITLAMQSGERVFAVAGFGHVVMQERLLRRLLVVE